MASLLENNDYRVVEQADQVRFVMPRWPMSAVQIPLMVTYSQALSPLFFGSFAVVAMIREAWFVPHAPGTHPPSERFAVTVAVAFGIWAFVLLLSYLVLALHLRRLGRAEVRLSKAGLESRTSLWPVRFRSKRKLNSLVRLAVEASSVKLSAKPGDVRTGTDAGDEPMSLLAHFSDQKPLILAKMFPRSMLERLAKDVVRASEADQAALSRTTEGPLGRHSKRWTQEDIAGIHVITRTYSNKGRSREVHTLELRRKAGRVVKLVGNFKKAELEWMGDLLSAALRIPRP